MKKELNRVREPKQFDKVLIITVLLLAFTSLLAIYSAIPLISSNLNAPGFIKNQIMWYTLGFIVVGILMYFGNESIYDYAKIGYWILLGMLIYLFVDTLLFQRLFSFHLPFAHKVNGATSWFLFPGIGSFQPSEFMKIVLIIITANIIQEHNEDKTESSYESDIELFIKIAKWALPPMILILLQPDTGVVLIILFSLGVMTMCSGIKQEWIYAIAGIVFIFLILFFYLFFFNFDLLQSIVGPKNIYKLNRIFGWLWPENYTKTHGAQLYRALLALGGAGLNGFGIQANTIAIPEAQTDFIFAVFGLGTGFIGCLWILGLSLFLDLKLINIATLSKNIFEKLMITGFLGMIIFQQVQNMGMIVGLLPITGITLPFISYGGSSLLSYMAVIGIVMNASMHAKKLSDYVY